MNITEQTQSQISPALDDGFDDVEVGTGIYTGAMWAPHWTADQSNEANTKSAQKQAKKGYTPVLLTYLTEDRCIGTLATVAAFGEDRLALLVEDHATGEIKSVLLPNHGHLKYIIKAAKVEQGDQIRLTYKGTQEAEITINGKKQKKDIHKYAIALPRKR